MNLSVRARSERVGARPRKTLTSVGDTGRRGPQGEESRIPQGETRQEARAGGEEGEGGETKGREAEGADVASEVPEGAAGNPDGPPRA